MASREMERAGQLNDGQPIRYALGLSIGTLYGFTTYSHGGSYGGYRSEMLRIPRKAAVGIHALQHGERVVDARRAGEPRVPRRGGGEDEHHRDRSSVGEPDGVRRAPQPSDSTGARQRNDRLALLAGKYYSDELDLPVTVAAREGVLVLTRPRADELRFVPLAEDLFTNSDRMLLRVVHDGNGVGDWIHAHREPRARSGVHAHRAAMSGV